MAVKHWADVLALRPELLDNRGQITGLQMSLYDTVFHTRRVPYRDVKYYTDITEPTPSLTRFFGTLAARLGTEKEGKALYHLDQGMGGGKSHALIGAYHLAADPKRFFETQLGEAVLLEARNMAGQEVDLRGLKPVVLCADHMTPGKASPEYGPATTLHERFIWALTGSNHALYDRLVANGQDKAALKRAFEAVEGPVLILLDELMDYALLLSDAQQVKTMPGELAFLNALMDAVDDVPRVACVVVMIASELDQRGYPRGAEEFRYYVAQRIERNGTTVAVTEAQDFAAIIQRRIFQPTDDVGEAVRLTAAWFDQQADQPWREEVFDRLGSSRGLIGFRERLERTYPFHPELMALVRDDWSRHAGFQRVRSTVEIFALTAHHWASEHKAGRWAPPLINIGDIPVTVALEQVFSSGLLHGNEKAIQGYRQVAATDVASKDGSQGHAVEVDRAIEKKKIAAGQPAPAVRMATALFYYSLVARGQAKRGATKPEVLAAAYTPEAGCSFTAVDEIFNALIGDDGLGALEVTQGTGGNVPTRYQLSTTYTIRMFYKQAHAAVQAPERDAWIWEKAQKLATTGLFDEKNPVSAPDSEATPLEAVFEGVDQNGKNRLVVLDPRRWTLLNGLDTATRADIEALFGLGPRPLAVDNAASCVVVCLNTQRRENVRKRAGEALAYRAVLAMVDAEGEQRAEAQRQWEEAESKLDGEIRRAYQHFAYLVRTQDGAQIEWKRFDDDSKTALKGEHVWEALVTAGRAVRPHALSGDYLKTLLSNLPRVLSLKEVMQQFKKNPAFPLVSAEADIREAIFQTLREPDAFEIVNSEGEVLTIASPGDLALGSMDAFLRRATPKEATPEPQGDDTTSTNGNSSGVKDGATGGDTAAVAYKRYTLKVPNRSLVDVNKRNAIYQLLGNLADSVDPASGLDLQLINIEITIHAAEGSLDNVGKKAEEADARWSEQKDGLDLLF